MATQMKKWADVLSIVSGKNQKGVENPLGLYPIYGSGGVIGHANDYLCEPGTTIVGRKGTINSPIFVNERFWNVDTAFGVTPGDELVPKYLFYFCEYFNFKDLDKSTTIPSLAKRDLLQIEMPVPPRDGQQRIVSRIEELSSNLDEAVRTLQETKQQLAVYRQAVMSRAFDLKKGWKQVQVSDIGEVNLGRQRSPKNVSKDYPTKYIRAANITENGIDVSDVLEMEFTPSDRERYTLRNGDIVLSEASGSASQVGKPAIWRDEIQNCCFQNTVIRHRIDKEKAIPEFIYWQYKYLYEIGYFAQHVGGVGINHLGAKNFSGLEINLAPLDVQKSIVSELEGRISACNSIEVTVGKTLAQAKSLRQSILKKAFEGRLV